ncbi:hypothetical protein HYU95_00915 [Candidatus Daviesbacteria bacterium]|nr:hypothetical protein [Candidatus Daviesbacteria bacterium]
MTEEDKSKPTVVPPDPYSERIRMYFDEHLGKPWQNHLRFVLNTFPQIEKGQIQYLIYGGAAIHLLNQQRIKPKDIDVLTRNSAMAAEFPPHPEGPPIDVHSIDRWLQDHQLPYDQKLVDFLFEQFQPVSFEGREVLVMSPVAQVWSKQNVLWGNLKRPKDLEDIQLLNVNPEKVRIFAEQIKQSSNPGKFTKIRSDKIPIQNDPCAAKDEPQ